MASKHIEAVFYRNASLLLVLFALLNPIGATAQSDNELHEQLKSQDPAVVMKAIEEAKKRADTASSPLLMHLGSRLFDLGDQREGLFWFYAGQLRLRYEVTSTTSGLITSLIIIYGERINQYGLSNPVELDAAIERAAVWELQTVCTWIKAPGRGRDVAKNRLGVLKGLDAFRKVIRSMAADAFTQEAASLVSEPDCLKPKPWKRFCIIFQNVRADKGAICTDAHEEIEARQRFDDFLERNQSRELHFLSPNPGAYAYVHAQVCSWDAQLSSCRTIGNTVALSTGHMDSKEAIKTALDECARQLGMPCRISSEAVNMTVTVLVGRLGGAGLPRLYGFWDISRMCKLEALPNKRSFSCMKNMKRGPIEEEIRAEVDPDSRIPW